MYFLISVVWSSGTIRKEVKERVQFRLQARRGGCRTLLSWPPLAGGRFWTSPKTIGNNIAEDIDFNWASVLEPAAPKLSWAWELRGTFQWYMFWAVRRGILSPWFGMGIFILEVFPGGSDDQSGCLITKLCHISRGDGHVLSTTNKAAQAYF